jgi:hypothetical protein
MHHTYEGVAARLFPSELLRWSGANHRFTHSFSLPAILSLHAGGYLSPASVSLSKSEHRKGGYRFATSSIRQVAQNGSWQV